MQTSDIARKLLVVIGIILMAVDLAFIIKFKSYAPTPYNVTTDTLFAIADILLVIMLILLITIIQKHFRKDLQKETMQLIVSQSTFVFSFVLRLVLIFLVNANKWPDFNSDFNSVDWSLFYSFALPL